MCESHPGLRTGGSQTRGEEAYIIKDAVCLGGADRSAARQTVGSQFGFRKNLDQATFLRREERGFLHRVPADQIHHGFWVNSLP